MKIYLKNQQNTSGLQGTNAAFQKKLSNSLGQKKQESLTNLEKIYMSRINVPKVPQINTICQSYKPSEEISLKRFPSKGDDTQNKKSSFVSKLKSKMKRSNTPNDEGLNLSKSYKNVYNNSNNTSSNNIIPNKKNPMKRSASSSNKSQKKLIEKGNNLGNGEYMIKRNNNFIMANHEGGISSSIELKNIQNLGIQINNNINVIINPNSNTSSNENYNIIKPLANDLTNNGLINTKITINGKRIKGNAGFMGKSKQKFNKINEVMTAMANERKVSNKDDKIIIFPTDYLKSLSMKERSIPKIDVPRGRENNFLMKEPISKSQPHLEIK